jgi:catalase
MATERADSQTKNSQTKTADLESSRERSQGEYLTTNQGLRIEHTDDSLKAGERGPTLLEDFHFREKITHFDHERIPERVVHARGAAAHGYFQAYESQGERTKARFLSDPSLKTPVFVRFSTVAGSRGSADTARDVRGFAVKFYTDEGVFDLVGNNIPIFFIQDAIKFPDLIHAVKPEPHNEMPQAATAHDTAWDFFSLLPEATHMVMWAMSDRAIPRSFRMMEGFGIHTFRLVNAAGKSRFVKFHWKPKLGMHSLVWEEAQQLGGKDPDWLRRDLWEAIEQGQYPEWEFGVQVLEEEDEFKFPFDILDPTKIWPEELIPVQRIGKMVLDRNPDNFFAETEQVAFHPGHIVPGIDFTNDPLLQGRLFSYLDTQITRLGGPNFAELPINRPVAPVHNNQRDSFHRMTINQGHSSYFPNSVGGGCPMLAPESAGGYVSYPAPVAGPKIRARAEKFRDYFSQATLFWKSLSAPEQEHLVDAARFELGKVELKEIRARMLGLFAHVDPDLARRISAGIGVPVPSDNPRPGIVPKEPLGIDRSPALSMESSPKNTIFSRRIAILVTEGVDVGQVEAAKAAFKAEGAKGEVVARLLGTVAGANGANLLVDKAILTVSSVMYDAVFIPEGVATLRSQGAALRFITEAYKHGKAIGAASDAVDLLRRASVEIGAGDQSRSGGDHGVVILQAADDFAAFVAAVARHRHWNRPGQEEVPA